MADKNQTSQNQDQENDSDLRSFLFNPMKNVTLVTDLSEAVKNDKRFSDTILIKSDDLMDSISGKFRTKVNLFMEPVSYVSNCTKIGYEQFNETELGWEKFLESCRSVNPIDENVANSRNDLSTSLEFKDSTSLKDFLPKILPISIQKESTKNVNVELTVTTSPQVTENKA